MCAVIDPRRFAFLRWGVVLGLVLVFAGRGLAEDDASWTKADTSQLRAANRLFAQEKFDVAEMLYRGLRDRHPNSPTALLDEVQGLDALGKHEEALEESRMVLKIDPDNAEAYQWVGISLLGLGQNKEAMIAFNKSSELDPDNEMTPIWLARTYSRSGNQAHSDQILDKLLKSLPPENQTDTLNEIAYCMRKTGDGKGAVEWWKKSAAQGDSYAQRCLAWAYSGQMGIPEDDAEEAYWARVSGDSYPWFPRVRLVDGLIQSTHGWILVAIVLLPAILLPFLSVWLVGLVLGRKVTTDPAVHWSERARRSYPFQVYFGFCAMIPAIYAGSSQSYPTSMLPISASLLFWITMIVGILCANYAVVGWARRYRENPDTPVQNLVNVAAIFLMYGPVIFTFFTMADFLPASWNLQAVLCIAAAVLFYSWIQCGGWIRIGRLVWLVYPADAKLNQMAAELAQKWNHPAPKVWMFRWRKANAFAFMFANAIAVTEKAYTLLSTEEMKSVLAHEIGHLCEGWGTKAIRFLSPLLALPLFTYPMWGDGDNLWPLGVCLLILGVSMMLLQKRRRRMEERADGFGKEAESEAGIYPQALAKLYESSLLPAVMPGKRKVHPHLYDRLLAAGITPDYARPLPPPRWGVWVGLLVLGTNAVLMSAIWLLIF